MTNSKTFDSIDDMQSSQWLGDIKKQMTRGQWPPECVRCKLTEKTSGRSIRLDMIERDRILRAIKKDYLIVGGVLDNTCNSACQSCHSDLSTKIGSLHSKQYRKINNYDNFYLLPQDRIIELDINGGEPTASPNYKKLLSNLPPSIKIIRLNTNGSLIIPEIEKLLEEGMRVIVTLSLDGIGDVHDYTRWPIKWEKYNTNVDRYIDLRAKYSKLKLNCWTTLSCLNIGDLENIFNYCKIKELDHSYGFCISPQQLDIRFRNNFTIAAKLKLIASHNEPVRSMGTRCASLKDNSSELAAFIKAQDTLRDIDVKNYFNLLPK
jgi:sulfatase maturation enzyme AslB (radical SAM superfamily)